MIINCNKCNKSFNVKDDLIPEKGRLLQCGNCQYKWFFSTVSNSDFLKTNQDTNVKNKKFEKQQKLLDHEKQHNNSNILSLGARFLSLEEAMEAIRLWLDTDFEGDRHQRRIKKLDK